MSENTTPVRALTVRDVLAFRPEHPVPHAGDAVRLAYGPAFGLERVEVSSTPDGAAVVSVLASAQETARSMDLARRALVRGCGGNPDDPTALDAARARMGAMDFADTVNSLAKQRLFTLALVVTGIRPFLTPLFRRDEVPLPERTFAFEAHIDLRPSSELASWEPAHVAVPDSTGDAWHDAMADACTDDLAARLVAQPAERYVELLRDRIANEYAARLEAGGESWEEHTAQPDFSMDAFKVEMTEQARTALRRGLVLDAVAAHEGITLDEGDLLAAAGTVARGGEQAALDAMLDSGQLLRLCEVALRAKATDWLVATAVNEG